MMVCKGFVLFWGKVEEVELLDETDEADGRAEREVCKIGTAWLGAMGYFHG